MKIILLLTAALFIVSCESQDPAPAPEKPDPLAQIRAIRADQVKFLNRKMGVVKQLNKLVAASQLDPNGEMKNVLQEKQQALIDLQTITSTHPSLQKLNEELSFWKSNQQSGRISNRDFEVEQANVKIIEIATKIDTLSKELPAIREAKDRIGRSEKEIASLRRSLAAKTPEGQALVKELTEIEAALSATQ
ncbi:MAG: PBP1b-binding outer membrane lipoprotein LpoB [Akkermansiaceae bacterium]|jgi:PBP1b-binding outer membrane lipoprotein LpoB